MVEFYSEKLKDEEEANKKTDECFSLNTEILDVNGNYLSMEKLINLTDNRLTLPKEWENKLSEKIILKFSTYSLVITKKINFD